MKNGGELSSNPATRHIPETMHLGSELRADNTDRLLKKRSWALDHSADSSQPTDSEEFSVGEGQCLPLLGASAHKFA